MSEKRFFKSYFTEHIIDKVTDKCYPIRDVDGVDELVDLLNEQISIIRRDEMSIKTMMSNMEKLEKENKELVKNFDDLVEWASEIAKRNVLLDEKIGKIQQAIRIAYEKKPYPTIEDIQKEIDDE